MSADGSNLSEATFPYAVIVALSEEFSRACANGETPSIAHYLPRVNEASRSTLLRNLIELELEERRNRGERPQVDEYLAAYPEFAEMIRSAFLETAFSLHGSRDTARPRIAKAPLPVANRLGAYRLVGELGRGGMGVVYEAVHVASGNRVALKTLPVLEGTALHRFKREFRAVADVNHPNLIGLQQLEADGDQWFFTMDLLEGESFLAYVRPNHVLDHGRLRSAMAQLVTGVMALHAQHVIHRDLKPSNVLVSQEGRVTILDFGLVIDLDSGAQSQSTQMIAGTPRYMAPEQAAGGKVTASSDWYAIGVMLYEALTGTVPFTGPVLQVLREKQSRDVSPIEDQSVPRELADLCLRLLTRDPACRADAQEIVKVVAAADVQVPVPSSATQSLVGREPHLSALQENYRQFLRNRSPITVFIRGRSGEGKTALADYFLNSLKDDTRTIVMSGRCYDRESVPFKALDSLIDILASRLMSMPVEDTALLVPDDVEMLISIFPVLQRVPVFAKTMNTHRPSLDAIQTRQRAFRALRSLLNRLGRQYTIVWLVDDLQWGDSDSAEALFQILLPPEAPPVMFLGTYRSDETEGSSFLSKWKELQEKQGVDFGDKTVSVGPLSESECVEVVVRLIGRDSEMIRQRAVDFARDSRRNPFLLTELAMCFDPESDSFEAIPLHEVMIRKLERLPAEAAGLLEVIAVSGQALSLAEATRTAGHQNPPMATITRMRNERLVRLLGSDGNPRIDTYHDRVRETTLAQLDQTRRTEVHRALAELIEREANLDAEVVAAELVEQGTGADRASIPRVYDLSYHFDEAGERRKAFVYALAGAEQAQRQSALEISLSNFALAKRNQDSSDVAMKFRVAEGTSSVLMRLGRHDAAMAEAVKGLELVDDAERKARIESLQAEIGYKQGNLLLSVQHNEAGLKRLGWWVPRSSLASMIGVSHQFVIQVFHRMFPNRLHRRPINPLAELNIQLLHRMAHPLTFMNTPRMIWTQLAMMNLAELYPPSGKLSITYSTFGLMFAMLGWQSRSASYRRRGIELSQQINDEFVRGANHAYRGIADVAAARYEQGVPELNDAIAAFGKAGDRFEFHLACFHKACCLFGLGQLNSAVELARQTFESSVREGDSRIFCSSYLWARATRGNLPFEQIKSCFLNRPDDVMSTVHGIMAEGHWHTFHRRTADALAAFERAAGLVWSSGCLNSHMVVVVPELAAALRRHSETMAAVDPRVGSTLRRRAIRLSHWAARLGKMFPAIRPHALRECALNDANRGKTMKAWKTAKLGCAVAEKQNARYEYAQSLLVLGQLSAKLGRAEAEEQIQRANAEIESMERPLHESAFV